MGDRNEFILFLAGKGISSIGCAVGNPKTCVQPKEQLLKKANEVPSEAKTTSRASQTSQKRCLCLGNLTASRGEPARCE